MAPSLTFLQIEILCTLVCTLDHTIENQPQGPQILLSDQLQFLDSIIKQQESQAIMLTNLASEIKDSINMSTENLDKTVEKANTTIQEMSTQNLPSRLTYASSTKLNISRSHAKVPAKSEATSRIAIIKSLTTSTQEFSKKELIAKANMVISLLKDSGTEPPDDILFLSTRKLRSGSISFKMDNMESANWLKEYPNCQDFLSHFNANAFFVNKLAGLENDSIKTIQWIKPPAHWKKDQRVTHAKIQCNNLRATNKIICKGLTIEGKKVYAHKDLQILCNATRDSALERHMAKDCPKEKDACEKVHPTWGCNCRTFQEIRDKLHAQNKEAKYK
ncbi:hypothetical protein PAXRUDRAFT_29052 [Paxillus rubicundulus Ve08.2h10]|uniref:Uncharacterized protein n=1 Tax=Paxillus rubicundulus Ve08.2h10 TaxID=930991 RepID=A0A0D0D6E6_9AGAM|nr:hypothetical protein PAXRUDRAFT_29052 [Paxillus rubicundulus Ve08.2h10]